MYIRYYENFCSNFYVDIFSRYIGTSIQSVVSMTVTRNTQKKKRSRTFARNFHSCCSSADSLVGLLCSINCFISLTLSNISESLLGFAFCALTRPLHTRSKLTSMFWKDAGMLLFSSAIKEVPIAFFCFMLKQYATFSKYIFFIHAGIFWVLASRDL